MRRVIIESPYKGKTKKDVLANINYGRLCLLDSLHRGEAPFASHLLYTQEDILNDDITDERELGIKAGFAWWGAADLIAFYTDLGMSPGMNAALGKAIFESRPIVYRKIFKEM